MVTTVGNSITCFFASFVTFAVTVMRTPLGLDGD